MKPEDRLRHLRSDKTWTDDRAWRPIETPTADKIQAAARPNRRRRWTPRIATIGGIAAVGAAAIVVVNASTEPSGGERQAGPGVVPWAALPPQGLVLSADYPTCDSRALEASAAEPGIVMGAYRLKIHVTNDGLDCALPDNLVTLQAAKSPSAAPAVLATAVGDTPSGAPVVQQGASVDYYAEFDASCTSLAGGEAVAVDLGISNSELSVSGTSLPQGLLSCSKVQLTPPPSEDDDSAFPGLTASIEVPAETASSTLNYTVTLKNTSSKAVTFKTCPTYKQTAVIYGKGKTNETFQLNCSGTPTIAAGQSVTYAMTVHVPSSTGTLKVGWFLDSGPSSAGTLSRR